MSTVCSLLVIPCVAYKPSRGETEEFSFLRRQTISDSHQDIVSGMTDQNWGNCIADIGLNTVAQTGKTEKVDSFDKLANSIPAEVKELFSDDGVFESMDCLNDFFAQKNAQKSETPDSATTPQGPGRNGLVGVISASSNDLTDDLLGDAVQLVGRRRGLQAPPEPSAKRPAPTPAKAGAAPPPTSHAHAAPAGATPAAPGMAQPSNVAPASNSEPNEEGHAATSVVVLDTSFSKHCMETCATLKGRAKDNQSAAVALVDKCSSMEIASVKSSQATACSKKMVDLSTKQRTVSKPISDLLDKLVIVLGHISTFADNQMLPSAEAKKSAKSTTKKSARTCDCISMFKATLSLEHCAVHLGMYVYRATWECRFESVFASKDYASLTLKLSTATPGDKTKCVFTLHDLLARSIPYHEVLDIQSTVSCHPHVLVACHGNVSSTYSLV